MTGPTPGTVICIAGGDGSGKSTQVANLTHFYQRRQCSVAAVTIFDAFADPEVAPKLPFTHRSDVYQYLKLLGPVSRTHFLLHAFHLALERALRRGPDVVLLNAYWYKYFATEVAHGGDPAILRQLAAGFRQPDHTFYLVISPEDALARKAEHSDYEAGYGTDRQTFLEFQRRAHRVLQALALEYSWTEIDGLSSPTEITQTITRHVEGVRS